MWDRTRGRRDEPQKAMERIKPEQAAAWAKRLGVTEEDLVQVMDQVGDSVLAVRAYIAMRGE